MRMERDLLGEKAIPDEVYYGVQTARALENFHISGVPISQYPDLIRALAIVKLASARANFECKQFGEEILHGIEGACQEVIDGQLHEQFKVDLSQGGAGTSTNMAANEVIANRALEFMGFAKGQYEHCDPHNHINCSQSTNDAYPTALHVGIFLLNAKLSAQLCDLVKAFRRKGDEFHEVIKMGRTQLQDAVPMTLGQEFVAFGESLESEVFALERVEAVLYEVNMGGTAIGTGLNAPAGYAERCVNHLAKVCGKPIRLAANLVEATQDTQPFVLFSSVLKSLAIKLSKICNDLRLLSSGPRTGLNEINLPPMQPGSSIMPGKVNPVIPEVVNMVCFQVVGNDLTITMAAEAGQLQLNVFEPVIGFNLFQSIDMLARGAGVLRERCVLGITANRERLREMVYHSIGLVTALVPYIGYERSALLATEALESGRGVYELVREKGWLTDERLAEILTPEAMTRPRPMPHAVEA